MNKRVNDLCDIFCRHATQQTIRTRKSPRNELNCGGERSKLAATKSDKCVYDTAALCKRNGFTLQHSACDRPMRCHRPNLMKITTLCERVCARRKSNTKSYGLAAKPKYIYMRYRSGEQCVAHNEHLNGRPCRRFCSPSMRCKA